MGRPADAAQTERQALDVAAGQNDEALEKRLRGNLERFEREDATAHVH
jgi:hypothetical protein